MDRKPHIDHDKLQAFIEQKEKQAKEEYEKRIAQEKREKGINKIKERFTKLWHSISMFVLLAAPEIILLLILGIILKRTDFLLLAIFMLIFSVIITPCFGLCLKISEWNKEGIKARVESRIGWWLISNSEQVLDEMRISCKLLPTEIEPKYLISSAAEAEIARSIIEKFQEHSKYLYFNIEATKEKAKTPYCYLLMFYLNSFLDDKDDIRFDGNKMYIEKSRERRDNAGSYYTIKYDVTDYGMVYNKLCYMARFYCEGIHNKIKKTSNIHYFSSDLIKKILDTQETTFYEKIK